MGVIVRYNSKTVESTNRPVPGQARNELLQGVRTINSFRFLLVVVFLSLPPLFLAQSDMHRPADRPAPSDAQKSFTQLKTLAGKWQGSVTMDPPMANMGNAELELTLR